MKSSTYSASIVIMLLAAVSCGYMNDPSPQNDNIVHESAAVMKEIREDIKHKRFIKTPSHKKPAGVFTIIVSLFNLPLSKGWQLLLVHAHKIMHRRAVCRGHYLTSVDSLVHCCFRRLPRRRDRAIICC